jgi:glycine/D-amino acid oxidase-like deaminating enzyme
MAVGVEIDGRVEGADAVVVAAGPWTPQLIDPTGAWRPIRPVWGVVAAVELERPPSHVLEEAAIDIEPDTEAPPPSASAAPGRYGFSLVTAEGSSALGSTFLDDERDPQSLVEELRTRGSRFVPSLAAAPVVDLRSCARPVALDRRPLVGRVPGLENAFLAAGHGPWGISTGPATARMIADLVTGRVATIPAGLDPARFGPIER